MNEQIEVPIGHRGGWYLTQPRKPWLVRGVIREGTVVFLSGKEGTGKSFVALELASCIAEGREFFGSEVSTGEALYVAAERGDSQRERLEALRDLKGVNPDNITFIDHTYPLNTIEGERLLYQSVEALSMRPKLIVIDTLRASFDGDENSSANAQATMNALNRIRKRYDSTILVVHHVNAWGKSRGSSAFIGAADTELYLTESRSKSYQKVYLTVRKQNNGRKWTRLTLESQEKQFGDDYSSIVFNLTATEEVDEAPTENDEDERERRILLILDENSGPISLRQLQKELAQVEGTLPNRDTLKTILDVMEENGQVSINRDGKSFQISMMTD